MINDTTVYSRANLNEAARDCDIQFSGGSSPGWNSQDFFPFEILSGNDNK